MKIRRIKIRNFRGIRKANIEFGKFTLLIGENNVGKTTILEALDLALGPERLSGYDPITEHDFYESLYTPPAGEDNSNEDQETPAETNRTISIEVILDDLTKDERGVFGYHMVDIDPGSGDLLEGRAVDENYGLRVVFHGAYDPEEDEFVAQTFFAGPGQPDPDEGARVTKRHKRRIGFLYLRSLRTARRAASLQRGSLLDILLRIREARPKVWENILRRLRNLGASLAEDKEFSDALADVEGYLLRYLPHYKGTELQSELHVGRLTREHLRNIMVYFLESRAADHVIPYDRMGTGVTNLLVLALLSAIAETKKKGTQNVIFAMEEPETALPPYTQRRIVHELKRQANQVLMTTHSPFVAEEFLTDNILILQAVTGEALKTTAVQEEGEVRLKNLRREFRLKYAEGLFARGVLIVEGVSDALVIPEVDALLEKHDEDTDSKETGDDNAEVEELSPSARYLPLTLSGVVIIRAEGDNGIPQVARFFQSLGVRTFAVADARRKADDDLKKEIESTTEGPLFLPERSMEEFLAANVPVARIQEFLRHVFARSDYPENNPLPEDSAPDESWRMRLQHVLEKRKSEGYAAEVVSRLDPDELPQLLADFLNKISQRMREPSPVSDSGAQ